MKNKIIILISCLLLVGCNPMNNNNNEENNNNSIDNNIENNKNIEVNNNNDVNNENVNEQNSNDNSVNNNNENMNDDSGSADDDELVEIDETVRIKSDVGLDYYFTLEFDGVFADVIQDVLDDTTSYDYLAYRAGIDFNEFVIVNDLFTEHIINGISIGDEPNRVISMVGEPTYIDGDYFTYIFDKYYILFEFEEGLKSVVIQANESPYIREDDLLTRLEEETNLYTAIDAEELEDFDIVNHINGGGLTVVSYSGLEIVDFEEKVIRIYNNHGPVLPEKDTYGDYTVEFINEHLVLNRMKAALEAKHYDEQLMAAEGSVSPDGNYKVLYSQLGQMYSNLRFEDTNHFYLPVKIYALIDSFEWIGERHIIYLDYTGNAYIVDMHHDPVNVSEFIEEYDESMTFKSFEVIDRVIFLKTGEETYPIDLNNFPVLKTEYDRLELNDEELNLIGLWQISQGVAAGYSDVYVMYPDHTFSYRISQMDGQTRERGYDGKWELEKGQLTLTITSTVTIVGGEPIEASGSIGTEYEIDGGTWTTTEIEPIVEKMPFQVNPLGEDEFYTRATFGQVDYYYIGNSSTYY